MLAVVFQSQSSSLPAAVRRNLNMGIQVGAAAGSSNLYPHMQEVFVTATAYNFIS